MPTTRLPIAVAVAAFMLAGTATPAVAGVAAPADGSGAVAAQVADAGSGVGPSAPCFVDEGGDLVRPCDDYEGPPRCL